MSYTDNLTIVFQIYISVFFHFKAILFSLFLLINETYHYLDIALFTRTELQAVCVFCYFYDPC